MTAWHWVLASIPVVITAGGLWEHRSRRKKKGLILALLTVRGESTGMELRDAGVGSLVYSYLYELEKDGFIERRSDGLLHPERGHRPQFFYKLKGTSKGAVA